jgi:hypothetical protein
LAPGYRANSWRPIPAGLQIVSQPVPEAFVKAAAVLREAADVIEQRNAIYGDNSVLHARLAALLSDMPADAIQRNSMFNMMLIKLTRYSNAMPDGGHDDSLLDLIVYSAALLVIDRERRA